MAVDNLFKHIKARLDDQVAAIGTRIYPDRLPDNTSEKTLPAVRYSIVAEERPRAMGSDPGNVLSTVQLDVYALTSTLRKTTADAVRAALQRYRGTTGTHQIDACYVDDAESSFESEAKLFRMRFSFSIWHRE